MQATSSNPIRSAGQVFSSTAASTGSIPFSSVSQHDRQYQNSPFISQTLGDNVSSSAMHSTTFTPHRQENDDVSWGPNLFQDILSFAENVSVQHDQVENSACYMNDENVTKTDFGEKHIRQLRFHSSSRYYQEKLTVFVIQLQHPN